MEKPDQPARREDASRAERPSERALELGRLCTAHRTATENFILGWHLTFRLLRRLGLDPVSPRGRVASGALVAATVLAMPIAATALAGDWGSAPVAIWIVVAATWGALGAAMHPLYARWIDDHLALHRAIRDEEELTRLLAWVRRWYHVRATVPMAVTVSVAILAILFSVERGSGRLLPVGSAVLGGLLLFQVAEITYTIFMNGVESRLLAGCRYALFGLSPIDSVAIRRALRGYNRVALGHSLVATVFLIEFLLLLPASSELVPWVALVLLAMVYFGVAFGNVVPRLGIQRIVQREKDGRLAPLQERVDSLAARIPTLSADEWRELRRLVRVHDRICSSSESVLPLATLGHLLGTLLIPTLIFVLAVAGEVYLSPVFERLFR